MICDHRFYCDSDSGKYLPSNGTSTVYNMGIFEKLQFSLKMEAGKKGECPCLGILRQETA